MRWMVAMRYFLAHKRQSLVCIAGVTISVMMFIAMDAMMNGFKDKFIIETVESSGHVQVNDEPRETQTPILETVYKNKNALLQLDRPKPRDVVKKIKNPEGLMKKIRALPGVVGVAPEVTGEAIVTLASSTGGKNTARVVGIFSTGVTPVDYSRVYMLMNNAQTLLDKKNLINRLTIRLGNYEEAQAYAQQIESIAGYKTESWQETNENFLKIFKIQDMITYIITGALLVVAAFGVLNILVMAVLERVNDIAILKSFGFSRGDITMIYLIQGAVIGLIGAVVGLIGGKLAIEGLRRIPVTVEGLIKAEGLLMSESARQYVTAFIAAMIVVILAAVYPARRAARFDPVEVIRGAH